MISYLKKVFVPLYHVSHKNGKNDYVFESDIEDIKCNCGGGVRITYKGYECDYRPGKIIIITCGKCDGRYILKSVNWREKCRLLKIKHVFS